MKKFLCLASVIFSVGITLFYVQYGGLFGNKSALSTVGLTHHAFFTIWGVSTYIALFINIIYAMRESRLRFHYPQLAVAAIGMTMTLIFDFDYSRHSQYMAHCIGSLMFSSVMGILVVVVFIVLKKYALAGVSASVMLTDLILLIVYKETALIEIVPIFIGYILLLINNMSRERNKIEING